MPGLLDVAPSTKTVDVNGQPVVVTGISAQGVAILIERFPDLKAMLVGRAADIDLNSLTTLVPDAIAALIAAGTGNPGDTKAETIAASLSIDTQLEFIDKIVEVTMPKGVAPFVEAFNKLGLLADGVQGALSKAPATN